MITENSVLTFGKFGPPKRTKLNECPSNYLEWMVKSLIDTDFHEWAVIAKQILEKRIEEDTPIINAEAAADQLLRDNGYNPNRI